MIVPTQPCGLGCGSPGGGITANAVGAPTSRSTSPATTAAIDPARRPGTAMTLRRVSCVDPPRVARPSDPVAHSPSAPERDHSPRSSHDARPGADVPGRRGGRTQASAPRSAARKRSREASSTTWTFGARLAMPRWSTTRSRRGCAPARLDDHVQVLGAHPALHRRAAHARHCRQRDSDRVKLPATAACSTKSLSKTTDLFSPGRCRLPI